MPKGPRKFKFLFERTGLTRFGGLSLFQHFCKSLSLRHYLQLNVRWPTYTYRDYHPTDLFLAHVFAIVAGIGRIENMQSLGYNGLIAPILGLSNFPHRDTLRTFFWRFDKRTLCNLESVHHKFRAELFRRLNLLYSVIIDADTTALMTFGNQEGVAVGYVPKRLHGNASYAPIISSEGRSGLSLDFELRSGNVHGSTGAWIFLKRIIGRLPSTIASSRVRVRLDGGFYDKDIIRPLDEGNIGYTIVAHMTKSLKTRMVAAKYHEFASGWEAAEFRYPIARWDKEHRFVAIRRPAALEPEDIRNRLFTFKRYTYHRALVTSLDISPEAVYRFYCDRAFQELLIREFKDSYHMAQIPTRSFWANAAYMETLLWAYDLVLMFREFCLPPECRDWNISTLRRDLWSLPAEWIRRDNRNVLMLPDKYPHQDLFERIQKASNKIKPLV